MAGRAEFGQTAGSMARAQLTKRQVSGGALAFVGYMLSPLSWWNDLFVNWPIALVFAWIVSWFWRPAFTASLILGYWLTNILGFFMMQKGGAKIISETDAPYGRKRLCRDLAISVLYTVLMALLVKWGVIGPIQETVEKIKHFLRAK